MHFIDARIREGSSSGPLGAPELPMTPGREVAGVVDAGEADWLGRRVVAHLGTANGGYAELAAAGGLGSLFVQAARHAGAVVAGVAGGAAKSERVRALAEAAAGRLVPYVGSRFPLAEAAAAHAAIEARATEGKTVLVPRRR